MSFHMRFQIPLLTSRVTKPSKSALSFLFAPLFLPLIFTIQFSLSRFEPLNYPALRIVYQANLETEALDWGCCRYIHQSSSGALIALEPVWKWM